MNRVIVMIDISNSVALRRELGEEVASRLIVKRIDEIEGAIRLFDPTFTRAQPIAGDGIFSIGTDAFAIFEAAVKKQGEWRSWVIPPTARIVIGMGEFSSMPDGEFTKHSGQPIDRAHRLLAVCPEARVVVTESVQVAIVAEGFGHMLLTQHGDLPGIGATSWYEASCEFVPSPGSRPKATAKDDLTVPLTAITGAVPGSVPREGQNGGKWHKYGLWVLLGVILAAAFGFLLALSFGGV